MEINFNWKIKLALLLLVSSALLYLIAYAYFHDVQKVIFYILIDMAFVPLDILIVVLVVESVINKKEKETMVEKLDMLMNVFFSEIGTELLNNFSKIDKNNSRIDELLLELEKIDSKKFSKLLKRIRKSDYEFDLMIPDGKKESFLNGLQNLLKGKRDFLIRMLENPNLLEKETFSDLLLAIFHLDEELERRDLNENIPETDLMHLIADIDRVYFNLVYEWLNHLYYLKNNYPYMFSLAIRTNPFDTGASVQIKE
ncbi:hypothetical protein MBCUT_20930 [Methanobrevibacter cuticularis]|uniref:Uncharacterized protein n=1 Tax=Methanobrevibacter cuticularis TaxID=47311 RepID=A0A166CHS8_9EURY|nr:hypothetical protein [Methanobrevibacter cuticularis]KZX14521.1 hypothetical protein MBCUT_20930 [Methanobrevibacter cuticularis]